jgi:predicted kinase
VADDRVLYLMQGVPGSGKSTIARMIQESYGGGAVILSTDDFRLAPDGSYTFDMAENAKYHQMCQRRAAELMQEGAPVLIIDNTNIQEWQAHPYLVLAEIWGYTVQVVSVDCGLYTAIERQKEREGLGDRAVPREVITDMYWRMERLLAPPKEPTT